jgi:hypothetical protein
MNGGCTTWLVWRLNTPGSGAASVTTLLPGGLREAALAALSLSRRGLTRGLAVAPAPGRPIAG